MTDESSLHDGGYIFTASKQPWVMLPSGTPAVPEYYQRSALWLRESLRRFSALSAWPQRP